MDCVVASTSLVPLVALLALATPLPGWARDALVLAGAASLGGIAAVFLLGPRAGATPDGVGIAGVVARLRGGLSAAREPGAVARSLAWAFAGWGLELAVAWLSLAAAGVRPTLALAALAVLATAAANAVAVSPANAGPFEVAAMLPLAGAGIAREPALAFALLFHLVHVAPAAAMGAWVLAREAGEAKARGAARDAHAGGRRHSTLGA